MNVKKVGQFPDVDIYNRKCKVYLTKNAKHAIL